MMRKKVKWGIYSAFFVGILCTVVMMATISLKAYNPVGDYGYMTTVYNSDSKIGEAHAHNTSGIPRYINMSIKSTSGNVIASNGGKVTNGGYLLIQDVYLGGYYGAYGNATIYNSMAPASGTAEVISKKIF